MSYSIEWHPKVRKFLRKLPKDIAARIVLKGKTISEKLMLRIINLDALVVMKIASGRSADIRDVFMLMPLAKDISWIKNEVAARCDFNERFAKLKSKVISRQFKDNLQGVYGCVDENIFDKHRKTVMKLENV